MENNIKNFIESIIYYNLAFGYETMENAIRIFNYYEEENVYNDFIHFLPEKHPAISYYDKIKANSENFEEIQLTACTKLAMWQIKEKIENLEFINNEKDIDELANSIDNLKLNDVEQFIKENEKLLRDFPGKYELYFAILYRYLTIQDKNSKNIYFLEKETELFEKYKFNYISEIVDEISEKYKYLQPLYDSLSEIYHDNNEYELSEIYYKKLIELLEKYIPSHNTYQVKSYLAKIYANYACLYWDILDKVNKKSEELINKAIKIREELIENYTNTTVSNYSSIAIYYTNIATQYRHDYESDKNEELKGKYFEFYKKAIWYREKLVELDGFKDVNSKVKNLNSLVMIYYFISEADKAEEMYKKAIEICIQEQNNELLKVVNDNYEQLNNNK